MQVAYTSSFGRRESILAVAHELLRQSGSVSIHAPLTDRTRAGLTGGARIRLPDETPAIRRQSSASLSGDCRRKAAMAALDGNSVEPV